MTKANLMTSAARGGQAFADAEEQGDKNDQISDGDTKLLDAIQAACDRMDAVGSRMDAMEENFRRMDSERKDSAKKDEDEKEEDKKADADEDEKKEEPKADEDEKKEEEGDAKKVAADAKKDSEEEEKEEVKADAHADHAPITRAEAAQLRSDLAALQRRAPAIISDADRERLANIQADADPVFQAFNDRAPAPMDGETPLAYKRRLAGKMQKHSPTWDGKRLSAIADESILDVAVNTIYADSLAAARRGTDIPVGQLRMRTTQSGGHTINEFDGESPAWINQFAGHSQRATGDWRRPN